MGDQARNRSSLSGYERHHLFYNAKGKFVQSAYVFGLDYDDDGRSAVAVDIDGDGDLDLVELTAQGLRLIENTSAPRRFARVRLASTRSPHALGATVALRAGGVTRRDFVKITDGFRSQVPFDLHFGLGETTTIDSLEVRWPSGKVEVWNNLPVMLTWAAIMLALIFVGIVTGLLGMIVVFPVLGHGSWHAYRAMRS